MHTAEEKQKLTRIYVGGLAPNVGEDELKARFASFGKVQEVKIILQKFDAQDKLCRGFAFISLIAVESEIERCISTLHRCIWKSRPLIVALAKPDFRDRFKILTD